MVIAAASIVIIMTLLSTPPKRGAPKKGCIVPLRGSIAGFAQVVDVRFLVPASTMRLKQLKKRQAKW